MNGQSYDTSLEYCLLVPQPFQATRVHFAEYLPLVIEQFTKNNFVSDCACYLPSAPSPSMASRRISSNPHKIRRRRPPVVVVAKWFLLKTSRKTQGKCRRIWQVPQPPQVRMTRFFLLLPRQKLRPLVRHSMVHSSSSQTEKCRQPRKRG